VYFKNSNLGYQIKDYEKCGHVACVREINANKYVARIPKTRCHFKHLGIHGKVLWKLIRKKWS